MDVDKNVVSQQEGFSQLLRLFFLLQKRYKFIVTGILAAVLCAVFTVLFLTPSYRSSAILLNASDSSKESNYKRNGVVVYNYLDSRNLKTKLVRKYKLLNGFCSDEAGRPATIQQCINMIDTVYTVAEAPPLIKIFWDSDDPAFAKKMLDNVLIEVNKYISEEYVSGASALREKIEISLKSMEEEMSLWEKQNATELMEPGVIGWRVEETAFKYQKLQEALQDAIIEEEKAALRINILSSPYAPERPRTPKKAFIILVTFLTASILSIVAAFFMETVARYKNPERL